MEAIFPQPHRTNLPENRDANMEKQMREMGMEIKIETEREMREGEREVWGRGLMLSE